MNYRKPVRHAAARVIAAIASIEMPMGQWPGLLDLISGYCLSGDVHKRELGTFVLYTVLESIVEGFQEHIADLFKLFEELLKDRESGEVRVTAVRALGVIAQYISSEEKNEIRAFQALLPAMIAVVQECTEAGDEPSARHLFDVFETLLILVRGSDFTSSFVLIKIAGGTLAQQSYTSTRRILPSCRCQRQP